MQDPLHAALRMQVAQDRAERATVARCTCTRRLAARPARDTRGPEPGSTASACTTARSRRRTRFRTTAPPTRRPTAYATRGGPPSSTGAQVTVRTPRRRRRPAASARNDARSRMRQIRPTGGCGPSTDAARSRLVRRASACGAGSRASSSASGCSAGTSSSRMASSNARAEEGPSGRRRPVTSWIVLGPSADWWTWQCTRRGMASSNPRAPGSSGDRGERSTGPPEWALHARVDASRRGRLSGCPQRCYRPRPQRPVGPGRRVLPHPPTRAHS